LILAPHPDDEIVACGLSAWRARRDGAQVSVFYLTTGVPPCEELWPWQRAGYAARLARRRREAMKAAEPLGLQTVGFLDIPSRCLRLHLDEAVAAIDRALVETEASEIWVPAFEGAHQDHDAANAIAARFLDRKWVWEYAAYNFAGGKVSSNWFFDTRGGVIEHHLSRDEARWKRKTLAIYASESANLLHIGLSREAWRPMPRYDYSAPPHAGILFRERFHWVPFRHPRIDFTPSAEIYSLIGEWSAGLVAPANREVEGEVQHVSLSR
jgi:LmbE family N-acetylglucosaminyl deacetylase